jgi:hypothetical protein
MEMVNVSKQPASKKLEILVHPSTTAGVLEFEWNETPGPVLGEYWTGYIGSGFDPPTRWDGTTRSS